MAGGAAERGAASNANAASVARMGTNWFISPDGRRGAFGEGEQGGGTCGQLTSTALCDRVRRGVTL